MMVKTQIAYETYYPDQRSIEYAVRYRTDGEKEGIEFEHIDKLSFPIDRLNWLIDCLVDLKVELDV